MSKTDRRDVRYYVASAAVAKLCVAMFADEKRARTEAAAYSAELGFSDSTVASYRSGLDGSFVFAGLVPREGQIVDAKLFKPLKECRGGTAYSPRLSLKAGKEIANRMKQITDVGLYDIMKAIGHEAWGDDCRIQTPGVVKYGEKWYLVVPSRTTPKGCKRITDVAYEAAANSDQKRPKSTAKARVKPQK